MSEEATMTRQTPDEGEIFLDHVAWFVPDIDAASTVFTRLGFPLTPYSVHGDRDAETGEIKPTGSANRLAMLPLGYLEFLVAVEGADSDVTRHLKACLARHTGVHLVAFTVADGEAEGRRLAQDGFDILPTVNLRRTVEAADGSETQVAFTVIRPRLGSIPEGRLQTISHLTPEHMWQERYIARENGIECLDEVLFVVDDEEASAERLARYTSRSAVRDREWIIPLDRGRLRIASPETAADMLGCPVPDVPAVAAVGFTGDVERVKAMLDENGMTPAVSTPERIVIAPSDACGTAIIVSRR